MKDNWIKIQWVIITVLILIIIFLRECESNNTPYKSRIITKTEIKYDTIKERTVAYIPKWKTKVETKHDTIYDTTFLNFPIDTNAILKEFFTTYAYVDTIKKDSVTIIVFDTVTQNQIIKRLVEYELLYPTKIITNTEEIFLNKREFYAGIGLGGNQNGFSYVGSEFLLRTKKNQAYGLGLGINENLQPTLGFKMYWKIGNK